MKRLLVLLFVLLMANTVSGQEIGIGFGQPWQSNTNISALGEGNLGTVVNNITELDDAISAAPPQIVVATSFTLDGSKTIPSGTVFQQQPGAIATTHSSVAGGGAAWTVHVGSVYKKDAVINEPSFLWDLTTGSPVALTEVAGSANIVAAGQWAWEGGYLYVRTTGSVDPDTLAADILKVGYLLTINKDGVHGLTQRFDSYPGEITLPIETIYLEWFGAYGDGTVNDSLAIETLLSANSPGSILDLGGKTYLIDAQFYVTSSIVVRNGKFKLKDAAAIYSATPGSYGRYMFHVRASNVKFQNVYFDGNSRGNAVGGRYLSTDGSVGAHIMLVGYYTTAATQHLYNIVVDNCTFYDAGGSGFDTYMQGNSYGGGSNYYIYDLRISSNLFHLGQGVQCAMSDTYNAIVSVNTHRNAYMYAFQWYYRNVNGQYVCNDLFLDSTQIDFAKVDDLNKTGSVLNYTSAVVLGKSATEPNEYCTVAKNNLYGAKIYFTGGMEFSSVKNNNVHKSETVGIEYNGSLNDGSVISGNYIVGCDQPGLYLDSNITNDVVVEYNQLFGNCTKVLSTTYGGRELDSQVYVFDESYIFRKNIIRKVGTTPAYGLILHSSAGSLYLFAPNNNDIRGGGNTADVITNTGVYPPVAATGRGYIGDLQEWQYYESAFETTYTLDSIPSGINGTALITCGVEAGIYVINSAGGTTTTTLVYGTANAVITDTNLKMCFYGTGNRAEFRNRLGTTQPVTIQIFYR